MIIGGKADICSQSHIRQITDRMDETGGTR